MALVQKKAESSPRVPQAALRQSVQFKGIGVHFGKSSTVTVRSAPPQTGIVFIRTDVQEQDNRISAQWDLVDHAQFCTRITNKAKVSVYTIEHLMAALSGAGVCNAFVEIDGPEVPILDGSSELFYNRFLEVGVHKNLKSTPVLKILKSIKVENSYGWASLSPAKERGFVVTIDNKDRFGDQFGYQYHTFNWDTQDFSDIASARTYGTYQEGQKMQAMGLALGASLDNTLVLDGGVVLNPKGERYPNEMARHKILDAIGDLSLCGAYILGTFQGYNSGHGLNNQLLRALFQEPTAYTVC